jgi:hypothetical protein
MANEFTLPCIDYARVYVSSAALELADEKNIDRCKFVLNELTLHFMENLVSTPGKLSPADQRKHEQRIQRVRNSSPQRTSFMAGREDWYTGIRTICTMIHLPDVDEPPKYKTKIQTIFTYGNVHKV